MFYDLFFDKDFAKVNRAIRDSHPYQILKDDGKDVIAKTSPVLALIINPIIFIGLYNSFAL